MALDDQFRMLSRSAVLIQAGQPFIAWLADTFPGDSQPIPGPEIYLLKSVDTEEQVTNWLRKNFNELFEEQLFLWYTDEAGWPPKRTYKMFREWFDVKPVTTVWDTEKGFIEKI